MNTNTQTIDERCAELAASGYGCALEFDAERNTRIGHSFAKAAAIFADHIIALRTAEAAQQSLVTP